MASICVAFSFIIVMIALSTAQLIGDTPWDTIKTTFPKFLPVPLNQSEAIRQGWKAIKTCDDTITPGNVYAAVINGTVDFSSMPIFNADGQISGFIIGMRTPGALAINATNSPYKSYYTSINGTAPISFWGIEAMFRDPSTVCTAGSTLDISFGDRLWFANDNHSSYTKVPLNESTHALNDADWSLGACKDVPFRMGDHWWRYLSTDGDCNDAYPIFVLYDGGVLHAWGVAMGNEDRPFYNSTRWEHPAGATLTSFFLEGEAPTCLAAQSKLYNSQHVYMTSSVLVDTTTCTASTTKGSIVTTKDDESNEETEGMKAGYIVLIVLCALLVIAGMLVLIKYACLKRKGIDMKKAGLLNNDLSYENMDGI